MYVSRSSSEVFSTQNAIRLSFGTWPVDSVTPKKAAGPPSGASGFVLQPAGNLSLPCEPEGWQHRFVKRPAFREAVYAKIDVVVKARHGRCLILR
jgi:hypothetical protein